LTGDIRERFGPLVDGLRLVFRAGLAPMLLFCLAFLIAQTAAKWLWELERVLIGPQDINTIWRAIDGPISLVNDVVSTVLLVCLLGAAIDRVLRARTDPASARTGPATAGADPASARSDPAGISVTAAAGRSEGSAYPS
jgi:hypothetical protein